MSSRTLTNTNVSSTYPGVIHARGAQLPSIGQQRLFDGFGNRAAISIGRECNGATICGTLSADNITTNGNISASNVFIQNDNILNVIYPVGFVIFTATDVNPGTQFTGQTWTQIAQGRFIAGVGSHTDSRGETKQLLAGNIAGEYNHLQTVDEMPTHTHSLREPIRDEQFFLINDRNTTHATDTAAGVFRGDGPDKKNDARYLRNLPTAGGSVPHNNIPPGFGLYVWQRIS